MPMQNRPVVFCHNQMQCKCLAAPGRTRHDQPNQSLPARLLPLCLCLLHEDHTGFLAFCRYASGPLHFLSVTSAVLSPDLCLIHWFISFVSPQMPPPQRGLWCLTLVTLCPSIMLPFLLHLRSYYISWFFFLEYKLPRLGTLPFSCCVPMPVSISRSDQVFEEYLLNEWTQGKSCSEGQICLVSNQTRISGQSLEYEAFLCILLGLRLHVLKCVLCSLLHRS